MNYAIFFECGKVYIQRDPRPNHSLCFRFEVSNRRELLEKIIPFFQLHPLRSPSKRYDFNLFQRVMVLIAEDAHLTDSGLETMKELAVQMHRGSLDALDALVQWERGIGFK